ncbi:hypothetical protein [Thiorhodococcus minor]|uniref:hypothetical protein n=1 Tax=Thiorhodococcus minor TaxID=57489 RepID=UPI001ADAC7B7|nr:hypothetical protein [Thiorhodococcus minor]
MILKISQPQSKRESLSPWHWALDNIFVERLWRTIEYEDIYLKGYASLPELLL